MSADEIAEQSDETSPRHKRTGTLLGALSPGLGYMYVGAATRGLTINVALLAVLAGVIGLVTALDVFPLLPLLVLAACWVVATAFAIGDIRRRIDELDEPYQPQSYNHWTIYAGVFLITYVLPIVLMVTATSSYLWTLQPVDTPAMHPTVQSGDTVLIQKNAYRKQDPSPGDLVALRFSGSDDYRISRVVAAGPKTVRYSGNTVYVGRRQLPQVPFEPESPKSDTEKFALFVEQNGADKYLVSLRREATAEPTFQKHKLKENELYLLPDNRTPAEAAGSDDVEPDSRRIGPVRRDAIAGRPRFIAWSSDPEDASTRWGRIGYALR